jgi:hypothetical protein
MKRKRKHDFQSNAGSTELKVEVVEVVPNNIKQ